MELNYTDYIKNVENSIKNEAIKEALDKVKPLGQFKKTDAGIWEPVHYAGYTIITPTVGNDVVNQDALNKLKIIKQTVSDIVNPLKIVAAPDDALHMTIARLISGEAFEKSSLHTQKNEFFNVFTQVFAQADISGPLKFEIKGLTVFPQGVIAAVVSPAGEYDYKNLQLFRDSIYSNDELVGFGAERKRNFHGHISLFYIEEELPDEEKNMLAAVLAEVNKNSFSRPLPYTVATAEVRKFKNFMRFYREDDWPAYRFKPER